MKRAYIPHGCHQQGRLQTGQWLPRRVEPGDFADTYPTGPAPLDGAHAATSVGAEPERAPSWIERITPAQFWIGYGLALGVCIGAGLVHLLARFGVAG